jgi:hypothetical protein
MSCTSALHRFISWDFVPSLLSYLGTVCEVAFLRQSFYFANQIADNLKYGTLGCGQPPLRGQPCRRRTGCHAATHTHIAVPLRAIYADEPVYEQAIVRFLTRTNLKRIVVGWNMARVNDIDIHGLHKRLLASLPANDQLKFVLLLYGNDMLDRGSANWFTYRVVDGTVWELEN